MFQVRSSAPKKHKKTWRHWQPWKGSAGSLPKKPMASHPLGADSTVESCSSKHASHVEVQEKQDDVSSVSGLSEPRPRRPSYFPREDLRQVGGIPSKIEIVTTSQVEKACSSCEAPAENFYSDNEIAAEDPVPQASVIRPSDELDPSSMQGVVAETANELDPEVKARVVAITALSTMMGSDHPDVLFSMKYLGHLLYRRGDYAGASRIANYVQNQACRY